MNPEEIFNETLEYGNQHANPDLVAKYLKYFKEGYDAFGLNHEQVKGKTGEILAIPGITQKMILETSLLLVKSPKYEMTVIAIQLVRSFYRSWTTETFRTVEQWFSLGITNWAQTDYICGELMNLFFKAKLVSIGDLRPWRTAGNKFQRRAAAVSLIKPMKLSADFKPYFDFIEPMMHDPAREVHQGLGWLLREMWKKQPAATEAFLFRFKETSPRLIFQYATEKMTAEGKERFRRSKMVKG